jgi:hypothetical protein
MMRVTADMLRMVGGRLSLLCDVLHTAVIIRSGGLLHTAMRDRDGKRKFF